MSDKRDGLETIVSVAELEKLHSKLERVQAIIGKAQENLNDDDDWFGAPELRMYVFLINKIQDVLSES